MRLGGPPLGRADAGFLPCCGMGEDGQGQHGGIGGESAREGQRESPPANPARTSPSPARAAAGQAPLSCQRAPAGSAMTLRPWSSTAQPLCSAAARRPPEEVVGRDPGRAAGIRRVGGQPGGTAPALQPRPAGRWARRLRPSVEHQQAREGLELLPDPSSPVLADVGPRPPRRGAPGPRAAAHGDQGIHRCGWAAWPRERRGAVGSRVDRPPLQAQPPEGSRGHWRWPRAG